MLDSGVDMINDIYAGGADEMMFPIIADQNVPYVLMHMLGTPQNMQDNIKYDQVVLDILSFFVKRKYALSELGANQILVDPGFGFGKTIEHNFELLKKMNVFKVLEAPLLVGLSRKSMIYKSLSIDSNDSLNGTSGLNMVALLNGASLLRVHDAKEANEIIELHQKLRQPSY